MHRPAHDLALSALVAAALGILACDRDEKAGCDPVAEPCVDGDGFALVEGTVTRAAGGQPVEGAEVAPAGCDRGEERWSFFARRPVGPSYSDRQGRYRLWLVVGEGELEGRGHAPVEWSPEGTFIARCIFELRGMFVGGAGPVDVTFFREWQDAVPSRADIIAFDPSEL